MKKASAARKRRSGAGRGAGKDVAQGKVTLTLADLVALAQVLGSNYNIVHGLYQVRRTLFAFR